MYAIISCDLHDIFILFSHPYWLGSSFDMSLTHLVYNIDDSWSVFNKHFSKA